MLEQVQHSSGAVILRSPRLAAAGVPHAFATRVGGVSGGPFASLNFGNPNPCDARDPPENIRENYRRLLEATGAPGRELVEVHQVHGAAVHLVRRGEPAHHGPGSTKADAMITADPVRALAIRTADCVPVLLASDDGRCVGAVHAGWRGIVAGVVPAVIADFRAMGITRILAAIGPSIGESAFEVGPEVAREFHRVFGDAAPVRPTGEKAFVDLKRAILLQLRAGGVTEVDVCSHCTVRDAGLYFSHRRDRGMTGRMASVIAPRP
jgi:polyphenol oxidase